MAKLLVLKSKWAEKTMTATDLPKLPLMNYIGNIAAKRSYLERN